MTITQYWLDFSCIKNSKFTFILLKPSWVTLSENIRLKPHQSLMIFFVFSSRFLNWFLVWRYTLCEMKAPWYLNLKVWQWLKKIFTWNKCKLLELQWFRAVCSCCFQAGLYSFESFSFDQIKKPLTYTGILDKIRSTLVK